MWYQFDQNNSGGSFVVNDKVCHRLFIEADDDREALWKAEDLGCYWDGVAKGMDCPCCGDRWSSYLDVVDLDKFRREGYRVNEYDGYGGNAVEKWNRKYGGYKLVESPRYEERYGRTYTGSICFEDIEQYAQFLADNYGWTEPDARIFYKDGTVVAIRSHREGW